MIDAFSAEYQVHARVLRRRAPGSTRTTLRARTSIRSSPTSTSSRSRPSPASTRGKISFGLTDTEDFITAGGRDVVEHESGVPMLCVDRRHAVERSKADQRLLFDDVFDGREPALLRLRPQGVPDRARGCIPGSGSSPPRSGSLSSSPTRRRAGPGSASGARTSALRRRWSRSSATSMRGGGSSWRRRSKARSRASRRSATAGTSSWLPRRGTTRGRSRATTGGSREAWAATGGRSPTFPS